MGMGDINKLLLEVGMSVSLSKDRQYNVSSLLLISQCNRYHGTTVVKNKD